MQLTSTQLPDNRYYETFDNENERNMRMNVLKAQRMKIEAWEYESANWTIYYVIYK